MRARVDAPQARSQDLANTLTQHLGKQVTSTHVRVMLHRARDEFAELLLTEVTETLDAPSRTRLEEELIELGLLEYCRPAVERLQHSPAS